MAYVGIIIPRAYRVSLHKKMRMKVSRFIVGVQVCNSGAPLSQSRFAAHYAGARY